MIGTLENMSALVAFGNAKLKHPNEIFNLDSIGTFIFNEWVRFSADKGQTFFADSANDYVNGLSSRGVLGLLLTYGDNSQLPSTISERISAGMVGGGKQYLIQEFTVSEVNYIVVQSALGDRDREDRRIWQDTYHLYYKIPRQLIAAEAPDLDWASNKLCLALENAINFCNKDSFLSKSNWIEIFQKALFITQEKTIQIIIGKNDFPEIIFTNEQRRLFKAADTAWVFGGMGSWNDTGPEDQNLYEEYSKVSDQLYYAVNRAIVEAVNYSSQANNLPKITSSLPSPKMGKAWWKIW